MEKKAIIIGGGIAGLSAGCYLQMNGYQTEIHELHTLPGGLCTSWEKNGYIFDTCIHWLVGSAPQDPYYYLWNELVDMKSIDFVFHDKYVQIEDVNGEKINVYSDVDKLEKEFLRIAPEDKSAIDELMKYIRKFINFEMPSGKAPELYNIIDKFKFYYKILPYFSAFGMLSKMTSAEFASKFKNPLLKFTLEQLFIPEMAFVFNIFIFKWFHSRSAGYPIKGSLNFAKKIEQRYLELGGKIHYQSKVTKILIKNESAYGIKNQKGEEHLADFIISAADGHATLFDMLEGKYLSPELKDFYSNKMTFPSYIQVSFGINKKFDESSGMVAFRLPQELIIDDKTKIDAVTFRIFNYDPTMAPEGKTVITAFLGTYNHEYWLNLRNSDHKKYHEEKDRLSNLLIDILDRKLGGIRENVEEIDVSTPATVIRYTNNWKGSMEGWVMTPEVGFKSIKKEINGLNNFYMAGQWVEPGGGLPSALLSARNLAQIICKKDKKKFQTQHF